MYKRQDDEGDAEASHVDSSAKAAPSAAESMKSSGKKEVKSSSSSGGTKRKAQEALPKEASQKVKRSKKEDSNSEDVEVSRPPSSSGSSSSGSCKKPLTKKKGETPLFSDKNCDVDLFHSSPTNVIPRRIKISNNMIVTCRLIDQAEGKTFTYDYAAITFQRRTGGEKMFEFVIPLNLAPRIIEALRIIVNENHKFFQPDAIANLK